MMRDRLAQPQPLAAESGEAQRALAIQDKAIDELPETELRRLLKLIGGTDPAALQRAAAAYTEMFCAVACLEVSVAALQPVAAGVPAQGLLDL
jgi:hypothetical protein